jgi:hypothetical protein
MTYWLALTFCLATAGEPQCSMRLVPEPMASPVECQLVAMALMKHDRGYRLPFLCTSKRPDHLPLAPAPAAGTPA